MTSSHRRRASLGAGLLSLCVLSAAAPAQDAPRAIEGAVSLGGSDEAAADPGRFLGKVYKDEAAGFRLAPPVDAKIINRTGVDLLSFVVDKRSWGGSLQMLIRDRPMTLEDYIQATTADLNKTFRAVQILDNRALQFQGRKAARLTTSMEAVSQAPAPNGRGRPGPVESVALLRQQLIIQVAPATFGVLTLYTPLADRTLAMQTFDAMVGSFDLYDPATIKARRRDALAAGKKWLEGRSAEELKSKLNNQPQMFRMVVGGATGTDVGYIQFSESEVALDGRNGIQFALQSRSFGDKGEVFTAQNMAFWAYSLDGKGDKNEKAPHYSTWANVSKTVANLPAKNNPARLEAREFWLSEVGALSLEVNDRFGEAQIKALQEARQRAIERDPRHPPPPITAGDRQFHLHVALDGDSTQKIRLNVNDARANGLDGQAIQRQAQAAPDGSLDLDLPPDAPAVLPKLFEYAWPRLVDVTKPSEMSFWVFNSSSQTLAVRTLIVTGKRERITVNGRPVECWKLIDELDPDSTTLWVDSDGRTVSMRTSDQTVLLPTTEQEMRQRWSARLPKGG